MGGFSEFWGRFQAIVAKLTNELKVERFSVGERIFTLKLQGVTVHPKRGVERDTHLVTCLFVGCQLGVSFTTPLLGYVLASSDLFCSHVFSALRVC